MYDDDYYYKGYDVAQICLNGHVVNDSIKVSPEDSKKFCDKCGAVTITNCLKCRQEIQGYYHVPNVLGFHKYAAPAFCYNCGSPFPWTESRLKAAKELAREIEDLSDKEKDILEQSIDEIISDSPKTTLAALRFKKLVAKAGKVAAEALRDILVDIVSETAKKTLWP
jgi:hypothetical protein